MEASSTVVIKVKYGDMLRRFNGQIANDELLLNMDGLRKKIISLFSFAPDSELMLTYIDEDNDVVALVDDDDLRDVVKQGLNPLRITVKVNDKKNGRQYNHSSAGSTPLRSPRAQQPLQNVNAGVSEILKKVPEPLRETLVKLSDDLASKASSSAPAVSELVDSFAKVSMSYLGELAESQHGVKSGMAGGVSGSSTTATESKDSELFKVDPVSKNNEYLENLKPEATMERDEVQIHNGTGQSMENMNVAPPVKEPLLNSVGKKEKAKKVIKCSNGKSKVGKVSYSHIMSSNVPSAVDDNTAGKEVRNPTEPKLGSNTGKSPDSIWTPNPRGLNFGSFCPSSSYECPFSGTVFENFSAAPPNPASDAVLSGRNINLNDGSGNIFHRGVRCDGCGIHPIIGPRFKSKVKANYDLCSICFEEMGDDNDYIRMDRPAVYRHHMSFKGLHDAACRARDQGRILPHVYRGSKVKLGAAKLDSRFIEDVNIFDGTVMAPSTPFTKIWRMRNNGTVMWSQKTQLVWIGGDKLSNELSVEAQIPAAGLPIDQELDVAVDFISPELPGRYISYWRMASPSGQKFGQRVWVLIQVDASIKESPRESVRNLNLNLPPVGSCLTGPEIINVDPEPMVQDSRPQADNSKKKVELGKNHTDQELKFPINDSLLVGNGISGSVPSAASPSVSYPIIDLSDVAPALPAVSPGVLYPPPPPPAAVPLAAPLAPLPPAVTWAPMPPAAPVASAPQFTEDLPAKRNPVDPLLEGNIVEEKLLRELEEMGFRQVDLNKEVLRMNEYDLEQAVDDLCGVAEWDPILEELQEMGFHDTEMNKMLLKKNNGSIKRVVMDLIAGEEKL